MVKKLRFSSAFTIVELLIVIVVIGILAAIIIISYAGIQQGATTSRMISLVDSYSKGVEQYMLQHNGSMPTTATGCLDGSTTCWGGVAQADSTTYATALQPIMGTLPPIPLGQTMAFAYDTGLSADPAYSGWYFATSFPLASSCPKISNLIFINRGTSGNQMTCRFGVPKIY